MTTVIVEQLAELQIRRTGYIRATNRLDNAAAALVRRRIGWRYDMEVADRAKVNARAKAIVSAFYDGKELKPDDAPVMAAVAADLETYRQGREPFVKTRAEVEKAMRKLAHELPVWPWVESVRGFGDLALAVMVAEAGALSGYPDRHRLWKRFGLTPYNGQAASTWRRKGGLSDEEWATFGYAPKRNAESYAVLGDPLFRQQSMIEGPYRLVYDREKARFLAAEKTKGHAHMHGLRCMRKALLEDLWRVWNGHAPKERLNLGQLTNTDGQCTITEIEAAERSAVGHRVATDG